MPEHLGEVLCLALTVTLVASLGLVLILVDPTSAGTCDWSKSGTTGMSVYACDAEPTMFSCRGRDNLETAPHWHTTRPVDGDPYHFEVGRFNHCHGTLLCDACPAPESIPEPTTCPSDPNLFFGLLETPAGTNDPLLTARLGCGHLCLTEAAGHTTHACIQEP